MSGELLQTRHESKERSVAIIGCGQMGSRHLQALARLAGPLCIEAVEPSSASREVALQRFAEVAQGDQAITLNWHTGIDELGPADLTIVASNAPGRADQIRRLVALGHKRFIVEKMVCQSQDDYLGLLEVLDAVGAKAWVNCARPYFPLYSRIIDLMKGETELQFCAMAGNLGLGCNAVHLLSLFQALVGAQSGLRLDGAYLRPELQPNKRGEELREFAGTILASTDQGHVASVNFHSVSNASVLLNLSSDNHRFIVDEGSGKALCASRHNGWRWEESLLEIIPSSRLTETIAEEILATDSCGLPTIQDSYPVHAELFRIFNDHIWKLTGSKPEHCPIT